MTSRTDCFDVIDVDAHDVHGLVVGAGGEEVARRVPRCAVDGSLVVLGLREKHFGRLRDVVITAKKQGFIT